MIIREKQLSGYNHIYLLNGYTINWDKPKSFYKYVPISRLIKSVEDNELVFVSPEEWEDPLKRRYYGIDCSSHGYSTENIACMSLSVKSTTNEAACWKSFKGDGKVLCVSYDKKTCYHSWMNGQNQMLSRYI